MKALSSDDLTPAQAASLLEVVEHRREQVSADLDAFWFPLVVFGSLSLLAAGLSLATSRASLGAFWLVASIGGGVLTARHAMRQGRRLGVGRAGWPYLVVSGGLMLGAFAAGALGRGLVQELGPMASVALGYLAFARIERSVAVACVALAIGVLVVVLAVVHPPATVELALLGTGAVMLASGVVLRGRAQTARTPDAMTP